MRDGCPFCDYEGPSDILHEWGEVAVALEPLNPVTLGHVLIVPRAHVRDASEDPVFTGMMFGLAAALCRDVDAYNLITSKGPAATQTVQHLHVHVIPRRDGDGLTLPWSVTQKRGSTT